MIFKNSKLLIFVVCLFYQNIEAQENANNVSFQLTEMVAHDQFLIDNIYTITHMDTTYMRKGYIYIADIDKISETEFNMYVVYRPLDLEDEEYSSGFIKFKDTFLIVRGSYMPCAFDIRENREKFDIQVSNRDESSILFIDYPEWIFYYKNKEFYLRIR